MKMGTLRTTLKRKYLECEIKIAGKVYRETINRSQFLKDTMKVPEDEEINVTPRTRSVVIHSHYSLMQEVVS